MRAVLRAVDADGVGRGALRKYDIIRTERMMKSVERMKVAASRLAIDRSLLQLPAYAVKHIQKGMTLF